MDDKLCPDCGVLMLKFQKPGGNFWYRCINCHKNHGAPEPEEPSEELNDG